MPKKYWNKTWFISEPSFERNLGVTNDSEKVRVLVLNEKSEIIAKVAGPPTDDKVDKIRNTLLTATPVNDP